MATIPISPKEAVTGVTHRIVSFPDSLILAINELLDEKCKPLGLNHRENFNVPTDYDSKVDNAIDTLQIIITPEELSKRITEISNGEYSLAEAIHSGFFGNDGVPAWYKNNGWNIIKKNNKYSTSSLVFTSSDV